MSSFSAENGPENWHLHYPKCAGSSQSPIDIVTSSCQYDPGLTNFTLHNFDQLSTKLGVGNSLNFTNNGHAASIRVNGDLSLEGGGLTGRYVTAEFHFHWGSSSKVGSEHAVDGVKYPLEMHVVNYAAKYRTLADAMEQPDGLAVLGVLFEISGNDNPAFAPLADALQYIHKAGDYQLLEGVRLQSLMPRDISRFWRYSGSLTTPRCYESVTWTVFAEPQKISHRQLDQLRHLLHESGHDGPDTEGNSPSPISNNWRPLQKLNGREVRQSFQSGIPSQPAFSSSSSDLPLTSYFTQSGTAAPSIETTSSKFSYPEQPSGNVPASAANVQGIESSTHPGSRSLPQTTTSVSPESADVLYTPVSTNPVPFSHRLATTGSASTSAPISTSSANASPLYVTPTTPGPTSDFYHKPSTKIYSPSTTARPYYVPNVSVTSTSIPDSITPAHTSNILDDRHSPAAPVPSLGSRTSAPIQAGPSPESRVTTDPVPVVVGLTTSDIHPLDHSRPSTFSGTSARTAISLTEVTEKQAAGMPKANDTGLDGSSPEHGATSPKSPVVANPVDRQYARFDHPSQIASPAPGTAVDSTASASPLPESSTSQVEKNRLPPYSIPSYSKLTEVNEATKQNVLLSGANTQHALPSSSLQSVDTKQQHSDGILDSVQKTTLGETVVLSRAQLIELSHKLKQVLLANSGTQSASVPFSNSSSIYPVPPPSPPTADAPASQLDFSVDQLLQSLESNLYNTSFDVPSGGNSDFVKSGAAPLRIQSFPAYTIENSTSYLSRGSMTPMNDAQVFLHRYSQPVKIRRPFYEQYYRIAS